MFQSTHPHGVRHRPIRAPTISSFGFNPRTHTGCDPVTASWLLCNDVCFNPRTHTGCDTACFVHSMLMFGFQSTHPHGVRPSAIYITYIKDEFQSTHPHGVRRTNGSKKVTEESFNPRTHTGCDLLLVIIAHTFSLFQSTHPHGVRLCIAEALDIHFCFNPRTHTGCDQLHRHLYQ